MLSPRFRVYQGYLGNQGHLLTTVTHLEIPKAVPTLLSGKPRSEILGFEMGAGWCGLGWAHSYLAWPWRILHGWQDRPGKSVLTLQLTSVNYCQISGQSAHLPAQPKPHPDFWLHLGRKECQNGILQATDKKEQEPHAVGQWCRQSVGFINKCIGNECCKTNPSIMILSFGAGGFYCLTGICISSWTACYQRRLK